jgi:hypothetical protein
MSESRLFRCDGRRKAEPAALLALEGIPLNAFKVTVELRATAHLKINRYVPRRVITM